jgi:hypothetical protein
MSSIAQHGSSIANQEHCDSVASQQPNCTGLNASAVNSDIWPVNIAARLADLNAEHDDLDQAVGSMLSALGCDDLAISRLKKRKLHVKDEISRAQGYLRGLAESLTQHSATKSDVVA